MWWIRWLKEKKIPTAHIDNYFAICSFTLLCLFLRIFKACRLVSSKILISIEFFFFFFLVWTTSSSLSGNNILFRDASWKLFCTYILNYFWFFVYFCVRHTSFFFHLLLKVDAFSGLFSNSPPPNQMSRPFFIYLFIILCLPSLILPTLCIIRIIFGLFVCLIFFLFLYFYPP